MIFGLMGWHTENSKKEISLDSSLTCYAIQWLKLLVSLGKSLQSLSSFRVLMCGVSYHGLHRWISTTNGRKPPLVQYSVLTSDTLAHHKGMLGEKIRTKDRNK